MATILRNARAQRSRFCSRFWWRAAAGQGGGREALPGSGDFDTSFGGSSLGTWIDDELGLPAFRYDGCTAGPCASEPADAFHQLGNGNVTAIAHSGALRRAVRSEDLLPARESLRRGGAELLAAASDGFATATKSGARCTRTVPRGVLRAHLRHGLHEEDRRARRAPRRAVRVPLRQAATRSCSSTSSSPTSRAQRNPSSTSTTGTSRGGCSATPTRSPARRSTIRPACGRASTRSAAR